MDIFVYGLQRSGNHLIIDWLFNNATNNGFGRKRDFKWGKYGYGYSVDKVRFVNNDHHIFDTVDGNGSKPNNYDASTDIQIISIENPPLDKMWKYINERRDKNRKVVNVVILRDILNTTASMIKRIGVPDITYDYYKQYCREIVGETHYLENMVPILYNKFVESKEYRNEVMSKIGIKNFDVIRNSGHSSFARDPQYNKRYTAVKYNDSQKKNMMDPDIIKHTKQIFNLDINEILK